MLAACGLAIVTAKPQAALRGVFMPGSFKIRVFDGPNVVFTRDFTNTVEVGRQNDNLEVLYSCRQLTGGSWRAAIARLDEDTLSRRHARIEPVDDHVIRITNLSA